MARDHFETHAYNRGQNDWNFNLIFTDVPQVAGLAAKYAPVLNRPELYPVVPAEWLHLTVLRAGFVSEFTDAEMSRVVDLLTPRLGALSLPKITIGPSWEYKGYPLLHAGPEEPLNEIFLAVRDSLREVVGEERLPHPIDRPADRLIAHIAMAYPHNHNNEAKLAAGLAAADATIRPVSVHLPYLSLVKQHPTGVHYEWEIVQNIPLGQAHP